MLTCIQIRCLNGVNSECVLISAYKLHVWNDCNIHHSTPFILNAGLRTERVLVLQLNSSVQHELCSFLDCVRVRYFSKVFLLCLFKNWMTTSVRSCDMSLMEKNCQRDPLGSYRMNAHMSSINSYIYIYLHNLCKMEVIFFHKLQYQTCKWNVWNGIQPIPSCYV